MSGKKVDSETDDVKAEVKRDTMAAGTGPQEESAETGTTEVGETEAASTRPDVSTRARWVAAAAIVIIAALAGALAFQAHRAGALTDAREDIRKEATTRVPDLLTYDKATLEDDQARALDQTTGSFTDDYRDLLDNVVAPAATKRNISTTASVSAAGVVAVERDQGVVLLFLTQTTVTGGAGTSVSGSRVEVTMKRVGDDWKIAGLKPV